MYQKFAEIYDDLMSNQDYAEWAGLIKSICKDFNIEPKNIIDLACGTGNMTIRLKNKNNNVTGVDISQKMIDIARTKSKNICYKCENMLDFVADEQVNLITCCCDGVNYILSEEDLDKFLEKQYQNLADGGLLIFDISSEYKLTQILGDDIAVHTEDDIAYIWESQYQEDEKCIEIDIVFFVKEENGLYQRFNEYHKQRVWQDDYILSALEKAGFKNSEQYEVMDADDVYIERFMFAARKEL